VIRAVIFDLDGTLINSINLIAECWSEAFNKFGYNVTREDIYKDVGLSAEEILSKHIGRREQALFEKILEYARRCFDERKEKHLLLSKDTVNVLETLNRKGILLGVATSSSCKRTFDILREFGIIKYFKTIQCLKPGMRGKPSPDIILYALKDLGVNSSEAIYVGDTIYDCLASYKAGVKFILLSKEWNNNIKEGPINCEIYCRVNTLKELLKIIDKFQATKT